MNNIKNIAKNISKFAFIIALVFVALMLVKPNTAAAGTTVTPAARRVTVIARNTIARRIAPVSTVNVVSGATEPTAPRNVVLAATEPTVSRNVVSGATEPTVTDSKVRAQISGPRIDVSGARITRK